MRSYFVYIILLITSQVHAQNRISGDTVKINEVVISGKKPAGSLPGFKTESVDTAVMSRYSLGSVAEVISVNSPIFIKNYGSGGSATPSLRGTGASGTQVTWNGLRIDNPMLGQSDLSIIPAGMSDRVNIYYGGSSMILNSGASGGIISLETAPEWSERTSITLNPGMGSFGKYSGQLLSETGSKTFQSVSRVFYQEAENNFNYTDNVSRAESFRDIRKNSEMMQKGFIQEFYGKIKGGQLSARLWYQEAHRNLPSSLVSEYAGESQDDNALRTMIRFENEKRFFITGAWMKSDLYYRNRLAKIDSRNNTDTWIIKSGLRKNLGSIASLDVQISEEINMVRSNNYREKVNRNSADVAVSMQNLNSERIRGSLLVRQILHNSDLLVPDFSAGLMIQPFRNREYYLKSSFARNSKIPSMNDLYWYPGGNPDLRNEYAQQSELGLEMDESISILALHFDLNYFHNSINDMIQWMPGEFNYWSASNIRSVKTNGVESGISLSYTSGKFKSSLKACYSYTLAKDNTDEEAVRQLANIPEHLANGSLELRHGCFHSAWMVNFTGMRYITPGSNDFLREYLVNNLSAGMQHKTGWGMLDLSFDVDNVFNTEYQNIAYFPLPGRTFGLRLLAQITFRK
ncbi:MAG: TonB-dependent receptor domain-containing protein [Chloroflexota bacterium]